MHTMAMPVTYPQIQEVSYATAFRPVQNPFVFNQAPMGMMAPI